MQLLWEWEWSTRLSSGNEEGTGSTVSWWCYITYLVSEGRCCLSAVDVCSDSSAEAAETWVFWFHVWNAAMKFWQGMLLLKSRWHWLPRQTHSNLLSFFIGIAGYPQGLTIRWLIFPLGLCVIGKAWRRWVWLVSASIVLPLSTLVGLIRGTV